MLTLQKAKLALEASEKKAKELNVRVTTTIVDDHGSVIASSRMDGAIPISPRFSYGKAYTSANLGAPTKDLSKYATEGKPYFGISDLFGGKLTTIAGGVPVIEDGKVVAGIGVGGSMDVSQDNECAEEALKAIQ